MGKIILVRHGQTEMNARRLYFGKLNPPLNELGLEQAQQAREKLLEIPYDVMYSSPLERTKQTAEICNYLDKEIIFDKRIEEIDFGIFEGLTYQEILQKYPDEANEMKSNWEDFNYLTGESPKELFNRVVDFLKDLDYEKDNLIIAHWGILGCILSYFMTGDLKTYWKFGIKNGSVVVLQGNFDFAYLEKFD